MKKTTLLACFFFTYWTMQSGPCWSKQKIESYKETKSNEIAESPISISSIPIHKSFDNSIETPVSLFPNNTNESSSSSYSLPGQINCPCNHISHDDSEALKKWYADLQKRLSEERKQILTIARQYNGIYEEEGLEASRSGGIEVTPNYKGKRPKRSLAR